MGYYRIMSFCFTKLVVRITFFVVDFFDFPFPAGIYAGNPKLPEHRRQGGGIRAVYQHYSIAKFYFDIRRYEKADYYFALVFGAEAPRWQEALLLAGLLFCC